MTMAEECRTLKDWFAVHGRDPFLWIAAGLPMVFGVLALFGQTALPYFFHIPKHNPQSSISALMSPLLMQGCRAERTG